MLFLSSKTMANPTNYKALFLRAEEQRRHEAELKRQEAELRRQAEHREWQAEHRERQERERNWQTIFEEFIQHCHNLLSWLLRAEEPSWSTTGKIPTPTGKHCSLWLLPWTNCSIKQQEIYNSVCDYLQPVGRDVPWLFTPLIALKNHGRHFAR